MHNEKCPWLIKLRCQITHTKKFQIVISICCQVYDNKRLKTPIFPHIFLHCLCDKIVFLVCLSVRSYITLIGHTALTTFFYFITFLNIFYNILTPLFRIYLGIPINVGLRNKRGCFQHPPDNSTKSLSRLNVSFPLQTMLLHKPP